MGGEGNRGRGEGEGEKAHQAEVDSTGGQTLLDVLAPLLFQIRGHLALNCCCEGLRSPSRVPRP